MAKGGGGVVEGGNGRGEGEKRRMLVGQEKPTRTKSEGGVGGDASGGGEGRGGGENLEADQQVALIDIDGMTCAICVGIVKNLLKRVPGVTSAEVSLPLERATVTFDSSITSTEQLMEAVEDGGYEAKVRAVDEQGVVEMNDPEVKAAKMKAAIRSARNIFLVSLVLSLPVVVVSMGFRDEKGGGLGEALSNQIIPGLPVRSVVEWFLTTPVQFGCGLRFYRSAFHDLKNRALGMNFLIAGGTTAAYVYSVVLVILAISTKASRPPMLFFETSTVLICFVLLGKFLEQIAKGKASNAVGKLLDLRADRAVLVSDWPSCEVSGELDIDTSDLVVGNVVKVIRGAKVPADGVVVKGNAAVDESMVTGESMPVHKEEGSDVIGATVCSEGLVYTKVTRTGNASALQQIVRLVEQAQGSKAPIQEVGDRVAAVFVPCVLGLSLLTLAVWLLLTLSGVVPEGWYRDEPGRPGPALFSFMFSLAVLVIACPCAVGLAAPTAILVGAGVAARNGVLIKGGAALQRVSELKRVVFDKTGTLTKGEPKVTEVVYVESEGLRTALSKGVKRETGCEFPCEEVLRLVASAERSSEHPLAKAIVEFHTLAASAVEEGVGDISSLESKLKHGSLEMPEDGSTTTVSGKGISCTVNGLKVSVGSPDYIEKVAGRPLPSLLDLHVGSLESSGRTVVVATIEGHFAGVFGLVDTLRPEAKGVVAELGRMGLEVWMLTGDNRRAAHEVARRAGIQSDRVCAQVLPGDKASKVEELQKDGKAVAMIGDGINDAPALATADVGIAVGGGTDVAVESADVVLMGSSLWGVFTSLDLCRIIVDRVRLNYFWALLYNTVGIPIAAGVFFPILRATLPPKLAGGAMALSSLSVLLSSLALRLYRPPTAARKASRAAAKASKRATVSGKEDQEVDIEVEAASVWTVGLACTCACCRDGVTAQLKLVVGAQEELQQTGATADRTADVGKASVFRPSCCHGTSAISPHLQGSPGRQGLAPHPSDKCSRSTNRVAKSTGVRGGGGPEHGERGCSCSCSVCKCTHAAEP